MNDIRMLDLQIPALLGAAISVPYVDRLQDGSNTPFSYPVRNWIGGEGSNNAGGVVPGMSSWLCFVSFVLWETRSKEK